MRRLGSFRLIAILGLAVGLVGTSEGAGTKPDSIKATPLQIVPTPATSPVTGGLRFGGVFIQLNKDQPFQPFSVELSETGELRISSDDPLLCNGTVKLANNPTLKCSSGLKLKFSDYTPERVNLTLIAPVVQ
jgi:hypothetical protein